MIKLLKSFKNITSLFLIFINNIPNISSQVGIYTEWHTTVYSCLQFDKVKLEADLQNDLQSVVNWGKEWLVNFNISKAK